MYIGNVIEMITISRLRHPDISAMIIMMKFQLLLFNVRTYFRTSFSKMSFRRFISIAIHQL